MAVDPKARLNTISYAKGTVTGPRGLLEYLFGGASFNSSWLESTNPLDNLTGRRRRKYGTRQRSSARAGEPMQLVLKNGEVYTVRITGTHTRFIDEFLAKGGGLNVANVYSERGTLYGPQSEV
jgi:hypothetical protein